MAQHHRSGGLGGWGRVCARAAVLGTALFLLAGCAHNTVGLSGDGRLFLLLDIDPSRVSDGVIQVDLEVEGLDPVRHIIFDQTRQAPAGGGGVNIDVTTSLDWRRVQGDPLDLVGQVVPGGSEVRFAVRTNGFDNNAKSFVLDGNTTVRLHVANPQVPGQQHIEIELTLQQVF